MTKTTTIKKNNLMPRFGDLVEVVEGKPEDKSYPPAGLSGIVLKVEVVVSFQGRIVRCEPGNLRKRG